MKRQQYQEKYILSSQRNKKISEIGEETKEVFWLFEELKEEILNQQQSIQTIQDNIEENKNSIENTEEKIEQIKDSATLSNKLNKLYYAIIGGGLGSIAFLYNPYIGGSALAGGLIIGGILSYL